MFIRHLRRRALHPFDYACVDGKEFAHDAPRLRAHVVCGGARRCRNARMMSRARDAAFRHKAPRQSLPSHAPCLSRCPPSVSRLCKARTRTGSGAGWRAEAVCESVVVAPLFCAWSVMPHAFCRRAAREQRFSRSFAAAHTVRTSVGSLSPPCASGIVLAIFRPELCCPDVTMPSAIFPYPARH